LLTIDVLPCVTALDSLTRGSSAPAQQCPRTLARPATGTGHLSINADSNTQNSHE